MQESETLYDEREYPKLTRPLKVILTFFDRLFDRFYTSRYNPLYRSGTLAVFCLFAALITGLYLIFFYRLGSPFESIAEIQDQVWGARWMRAMHRWVSDAAVVAVAFHVLRLLVQGKTWGPRMLAWVTGVLLTGFMFISAWTGYVMVWDEHGMAMAKMGAKILDLLPIFPESIERSFTGGKPVPASFFFMNLFAHVAVPLGMILVLWLHTSKLARSKWLPERNLTYWLTGIFIVFSILVPAPMLKKADLLMIPGGYPTDLFYNFWMPLVEWTTTAWVFAGSLVFTLVLTSMPWWWRPKNHKKRETLASLVEEKRCEGCAQCYSDCPFDAILMKDRQEEGLSPQFASVNPALCVSCGICSASCSSLAIGPPDRNARDMIRRLKAFCDEHPVPEDKGLVFVCRHSDLAAKTHDEAKNAGWLSYSVECTGTLHSAALTFAAKRFGRTAVAGCPENDCLFREGTTWLSERWQRKRGPELPEAIAQDAVFLFSGSRNEGQPLWQWMRDGSGTAKKTSSPGQWTAGLVATILLLAGIALGSQVVWNQVPEHGAIRIGWRLPGQKIETCRDLSPEELAHRLPHMRRPRECTVTYINYRLKLFVDNVAIVDELVLPPGLKHDRPLDVNYQHNLAPGEYNIRVEFAPDDDLNSNAPRFELTESITISKQRIVLIALSESEHRLKSLHQTPKDF
ncbi:MAG: cytochrome b N-terminal domain-containing protein [Bdellovibrionaceae bacterium]|nr:cytochrome b N-terminal domain-containing protein [Bdellovibrionales bacterium]MCB9083060.1 cytochrome b N-terminal domain-containing protein [Pseudobdellovibrionaceae bacterium]